ncbi:fructose-specific PTS transporter subunit EIIC [Clostridium estertheticum]|uniref:PTS fructose transporter subunit IIC n=1 Tax=Clostridium estertheticum TaxID=238834 RepID=UPI001C0AEFAE|nr:fructose-specific PTS transporter subunit EIIC [Clostridium estertheticum]MBU3217475.1 fructose-specific PTS transporter subunit EIIC [Clostridium estertheticum]WAG56655.1 fructose-specific PTS transporter subunit EIIC [Clostridium estertheticum]
MKNIVAITACPTGVAHTYMAAAALEKSAKELGVYIKVETQGASAPENVLTAKDIEAADIVIISAAKEIDLSRFNGKKLVEVSINKVVRDAKKVLEEILVDKDISIYELKTEHKEKKKAQQVGIYKHLMTGVYTMLPFVVAGGILIALSFAFGIHAGDPKDPSYNIIAGAFSKIGGDVAFGLMVPVLAAGIAYSIAGKEGIVSGMVAGMLAKLLGAGFLGGLVGGLLAGYLTAFLIKNIKLPKSVASLKTLIIIPILSVGITGFVMVFIVGTPVKYCLDALTYFLNGLGTRNGVLFGALIGIMMASDMGGPLNKAISTFCIGLMASGVYAPIAACMVAGMTPPLGLALATVIFKNKFTEEEREAGKSCWVLGLSYITEGAIPFAVADPIRVIPSLMIGSGVAGAISLGFNCTSLAPHGGIWIAPIPHVIGNLPMYILALVTGTIVTCFCVGLLKKKKMIITRGNEVC